MDQSSFGDHAADHVRGYRSFVGHSHLCRQQVQYSISSFAYYVAHDCLRRYAILATSKEGECLPFNV